MIAPISTPEGIPFSKTALVGNELAYMTDALLGGHTSGDGRYTKRCSLLLETMLGASRVLLTTSCTHALEMSALLLDIRPGDEVILPSYTFVSTANAFVLRGAKPVFVDIRQDTLNIDEKLIEGHITKRTKAIIAVHYAGVGCAMGEIMELARRHNIAVVEDNAHGLLGRYRGQQLGTFGGLATQSFHDTKNLTCGEGGALVINDPAYVERAEIIREKGTDRSKLFRGLVDKYTWVDLGSSYLLSDVLAAMLLAQLEARETIQMARQKVWERYRVELSDWASARGIRLPVVPTECEQPYHMFYLLLPTLEQRAAFIAHMKARNISCPFHYLPLHLSRMGESFGGHVGLCPVTEAYSDQLVRLPLHLGLKLDEVSRVIESARSFR